MSSASPASQQIQPAPSITSDPRYRAARRLISSGRSADGAIEMLATLVEEARSKYGEDSVEAAAVYYEYGNSLFRAVEKRKDDEEVIMRDGNDDKPTSAASSATTRPISEMKPDAAADSTSHAKSDAHVDKMGDKASRNSASPTAKANEKRDSTDEELALELMENAFAIYDQYYDEAVDKDGNEKEDGEASRTVTVDTSLVPWVEEQLPRVLGGIGDVLTALGRHPDAVDAYTRKAQHLDDALRDLSERKGDKDGEEIGLDFLRALRILCEANILVAEALLRCPLGQDCVLSETGDVLVEARELVDYAQGYYDQARDELQETLYIMGRMAPKSSGDNVPEEVSREFATEKENVCFCAQMLGGVGNLLAARDEEQEKSKAHNDDGNGPDAKKPRVSDD